MNATGCASLTVDTSVFFNTKFENKMQDTFLVNVNITEEGTGELLADLTNSTRMEKVDLLIWCFSFPRYSDVKICYSVHYF